MMLGGSRQAIRASQTMPQLHYTKEDIQEQYLSAKALGSSPSNAVSRPEAAAGATTGSSASHRAALKRFRAQSSGPIGKRGAGAGRDDDGDDNEPHDSGESCSSSLEQESQNGGQQRQRARGRQTSRHASGRKRARSASLFSACFSIPHLASKLAGAQGQAAANSSQPVVAQARRSILAHLGLGGGHHQSAGGGKRRQRPISASQTTGNLERAAAASHQSPGSMAPAPSLNQSSSSLAESNGRSQPASSQQQHNSPMQLSGARKHVSFGGHQAQQAQARLLLQQQQQQQQNLPPASSTEAADGPSAPEGAPATCQVSSAQLNQQQQRNQPATGSSFETGRSNNVIMRNYQPRQAAGGSAPSATEPASQRQQANDRECDAGKQSAPDSRESPLASNIQPADKRRPKATLVGAASDGSGAYSLQQQQGPQIVQRQSSCGQPQASLAQGHQQQMQRPVAGRCAPQPPRLQEQQQQMRPQQRHQQETKTVYKRLPAVPMRTQATQTEITAYHLMGTPPLSSSSSAAGRSRQRAACSGAGGGADTPSSATTAAPSASQTPVRQAGGMMAQSGGDRLIGAGQRATGREEGSGQQQRPPPKAQAAASSSAGLGAVARPSDDAEGEQAELEAEEDQADDDECGNLNASTLASSNSSSSVSLVGHDSTLLASALLDEGYPRRDDQCERDNNAERKRRGDQDHDEDNETMARRLEQPSKSGEQAKPQRTRQAEKLADGSSASIMLRGNDQLQQQLQGQPGQKAPVRPESGLKEQELEQRRHVIKLKNDNKRPITDGETSAEFQRARQTRTKASSDIEPPRQFKDNSLGPAPQVAFGQTSSARICSPPSEEIQPSDLALNMNSTSGLASVGGADGRRDSRSQLQHELAKASGTSAAADAPQGEDLWSSSLGARFAAQARATLRSGVDDNDHDDDYGDDEPASSHFEKEQRAPSPPSLSEASSQTDASFGPEARLSDVVGPGGLAGFGGGQQRPDESMVRMASESSRASVTAATTVAAAAAAVAAASGGSVANLAAADLNWQQASRLEPRPACTEVARSLATRPSNNDGDDDGGNARPASLERRRPINRPQGAPAKRDIIMDNGGDCGDAASDADQHRRADPQLQLQLQDTDLRRAEALVSSGRLEPKAGRSQRRLVAPGASPAELRRDDFLTLNQFELMAAVEEPVARQAAQLDDQDGDGDGGQLTTPRDAPPSSSVAPLAASRPPQAALRQQRSQRQSTSTLSARHHSYCSSDDFGPSAHLEQLEQLELSSSPGVSPGFSNLAPATVGIGASSGSFAAASSGAGGARQLEFYQNQQQGAPAQAAIAAAFGRSASRDLDEIDESPGDGSSNLDAAGSSGDQQRPSRRRSDSVEPLAATGPPSPLESEATGREQGADDQTNVAGPLGRNSARAEAVGELGADQTAASGADKGTGDAGFSRTIKRECEPAGRFMMASGHKMQQASAASGSGDTGADRGQAESAHGGGGRGACISAPLDGQPERGQAQQTAERRRVAASSAETEPSGAAGSARSSWARQAGGRASVGSSSGSSSSFAGGQTRRPSSGQQQPAAAPPPQLALEGQQQGAASRQPRRKSSSSPPTTVSELDQDEELSTPSFVDSYRTRLEQVCVLADAVVGELIGECLTKEAGASRNQPHLQPQQWQQHGQYEERRQQVADDGQLMRIDENAASGRAGRQSGASFSISSGSPSADNSQGSLSQQSSSSTSVSGHSYVCCHPKSQQHQAGAASAPTTSTSRQAQPERPGQPHRPRLPEKPAHLKVQQSSRDQPAAEELEQRLEGEESQAGRAISAYCSRPGAAVSAAALAVTATSIAAAAAAAGRREHPAELGLEALEDGRTLQDHWLAEPESGDDGQSSRNKDTKRAEGKQACFGGDSATVACVSGNGGRPGVAGDFARERSSAGGHDYHGGGTSANEHRAVAPATTESMAGAKVSPDQDDDRGQDDTAIGFLAAEPSSQRHNYEQLAWSSLQSADGPARRSRSASLCSAGSEMSVRLARRPSGAGAGGNNDHQQARFGSDSAGSGAGLRPVAAASEEAALAGQSSLAPPSEGLDVSAEAPLSSTEDQLTAALALAFASTIATKAATPTNSELCCVGSPAELEEASCATTTASTASSTAGCADCSGSSWQAVHGSQRGPQPSPLAGGQELPAAEGQDEARAGGQVARSQPADPLCSVLLQEAHKQRLKAPATSASESQEGGRQQEQVDSQGLPTRRSSQELSTVSEASEDISEPAGQLRRAAAAAGRPQQQQHSLQPAQSKRALIGGGELSVMADLATEQDLVHSEYTLRSQGSEAAGLLTTCSAGVSVSQSSNEVSDCQQAVDVGGADSQMAPSRQQQPLAPVEKRRCSLGATGIGSQQERPASAAVGASSTTGSLSSRMKSHVDCPYVRDILPLSSPPPSQSSVKAAAAAFYLRRLSHDDTMEAIEDDVEGEEQEMMQDEGQQQTQQQQVTPASSSAPISIEPLAIAPPAAFLGNSPERGTLVDDRAAPVVHCDQEARQAERDAAAVAKSIREEDEEEEEESSISVSQHGVIVSPGPSSSLATAAAPAAGTKRRKSNDDASGSAPDSPPGSSSLTGGGADEHGFVGGVDVGGGNKSRSSKQGGAPTAIKQPRLEAAASASGASAPAATAIGAKVPASSVGSSSTVSDQGKETRSSSVRPISVDDLQLQLRQQPSATSSEVSSESATNAILEHLSRHHSDRPEMDEHSSDLEQSRSIDPQLRRESWRREVSSSRHLSSATTCGAACTTGNQGSRGALEEDQSGAEPTVGDRESSCSPTGTIKRRGNLGAGSNSRESSQASDSTLILQSQSQHQQTQQQRRGPPLAQIRAANEQQQQQVCEQQTCVSLPPADNLSICSSCSCQEASFDLSATNQEQKQPEQAGLSQQQPSAQAAVVGEPSSATAAGQKQTVIGQQQQADQHRQQPKRQNWMSSEEGTVFTENYWLSHWLYVSEHEEAEIWRRAIDMNQVSNEQQQPGSGSSQAASGSSLREGSAPACLQSQPTSGMPKEMNELSSTSSERSFSAKYKSTTRKMIHRRASIEMYRRLLNNNLKREKRVEISRSNGEFGFRIHGSRPVVVSAIERGTSAETCGLQVGDLIYAINGTNILDMAHSDVVKLAHSADSAALVLDLVPTNDFLRMSKYDKACNKRHEPTVTGFLMRLSPSTAQPLLVDLQEQMSRQPGVGAQKRAAKLNEVMRLAWRQRYFVLRSDNCLYWYRVAGDIEPHGGINLQGFSASLTNEFSEPSYVIRLVKYGGQPHYLGTNNICDIQTWIDAINKAATEANQNDPYMKRTLTLARGKPNQIPEPDCCGYLYKFSHKRSGGAHWRAAYFVLKDACLYLFRDQQADSVSQASAVYYLHGYRVRSKHIEHKKHTFELIPPNRKTIRPMFLMASSEIDKKRWIAALEYSIDRWLEID